MVRDAGRPEQGPVAGTMDQVRPMSSQQGSLLRVFRLADLLLSNPIRWRPSADPGQKRDPGDRIKAQRD